jgi:hypothetical protein
VSVQIASIIRIREAGFDEYWLQDQIYENPVCLGLGELESISKERPQSSGGRLDILLKDPQDDSMYEVEVMLGQTDESHIIRTIEYWDNEKRRWPQRQHYAVLVAECITKRFFNIIHLLSYSIPIIAIQVNLIESDGKKLLHFSKILDTYEEPDDGGADEIYDEAYWTNRAIWTLQTANEFLSTISRTLNSPVLRYCKGYIAINVCGNNYFSFHKRSSQKTLLIFKVKEEFKDDVIILLDNDEISYTLTRRIRFKITLNKGFIKEHADTLQKITECVKDTWKK